MENNTAMEVPDRVALGVIIGSEIVTDTFEIGGDG